MLTTYEEEPEEGKNSGGVRALARSTPTRGQSTDGRSNTLKASAVLFAVGNYGRGRSVTTRGQRRVKTRTASRQERSLKSEPWTWQRERVSQGPERRPPWTWKTSWAVVPLAWDASGAKLGTDVAMTEQTLWKAARRTRDELGEFGWAFKRSPSAKEDSAVRCNANSRTRSKEIHEGDAATRNVIVASGNPITRYKDRGGNSKAHGNLKKAFSGRRRLAETEQHLRLREGRGSAAGARAPKRGPEERTARHAG